MKKIIIIAFIASSAFVSQAYAITFDELIDLFVSAGVILPEKEAQARQIIGSIGNQSLSQQCIFGTQLIASSENIVAYQIDSVPFGGACTSEVRVCTDGILSGSYQYNSCSVEPGVAPSIITQPESIVVTVGQSPVFSVVADGENLTYRWQKFENGTWTNLPLAYGRQFGIGNIQPSHAGQYRVVVSNPIGSVISTSITIAVREDKVINGNFSQLSGQPLSVISTGSFVETGATSWGGGPGFGANAVYEIVQTAPPGSTGNTLRISWNVAPSAAWGGEGQHSPAYRFTFLENHGIRDARIFSGKNVEVTFKARVQSGTINIVPIIWHSYDAVTPGIVGVKGVGYEIFESAGSENTVKIAQGDPHPAALAQLTQEWKTFTQIITIPDISDKTLVGAHYTGIGFDFDKRYGPVVEIADVAAYVLSDADFPVGIAIQPVSVVVPVGAAPILSVTATGSNPQYRWQKFENGTWTNLPLAYGRQFGIGNIQPSHAGQYRVRVHNATSEIFSNVVSITVN